MLQTGSVKARSSLCAFGDVAETNGSVSEPWQKSEPARTTSLTKLWGILLEAAKAVPEVKRTGDGSMEMLEYCRAMAAFCRRRAQFEREYDAFWMREAAEWDILVCEYATSLPHSKPSKRPDVKGTQPSAPKIRTNLVSAMTSKSSTHCSLRYRCPKTAAQRNFCRGPCELLLECG